MCYWMSSHIINIILFGYVMISCHSKFHYINWSLATDRGHSHKEREYSHPAYNEISLSPCDLTEDSCDVNCCSDQDCSKEQKEGFNCIGDLQDVVKTESLTRHSCKHMSDTTYDGWFQFFCYIAANTPYLGEYFITQKKIETLSKFSNTAMYRKDMFDYSHGVKTEIEVSDEHYSFGSPIKMVLNGDSAGDTKYLNMPANMFFPNGGMCIDEAPVRFLVNRESNCMRSISKNICKNIAQSALNLQRHIVVDYDSNDTASNSRILYVAKNGKGQNSTYSELKFLCFKNGSDYITFSRNVFRVNASKILFSSNFYDNEDPFLSECSASKEGLNTSYDESKEVCRNVLISVNYDFLWNGTEIVNLLVTYIVADVPVTLSAFVKLKIESSSDLKDYKLNDFVVFNDKSGGQEDYELYVTQRFVSSFRHHKDKIFSDNNDTFTEEEVVTYSGNPGYEFGRPVIAVQNNGSAYSWEELYLAVWGNDGSRFENTTTQDTKVGCAFVIYNTYSEVHSALFKLTSCCSVFQAKLLAIRVAIKWCIENERDACIRRDSQSALQAIEDKYNLDSLALINENSYNICLSWVRGHAGNSRNERADELAKSSAELNLHISYALSPLSFLKKQIHKHIIEKWNQIWRESDKGSTTRKCFFPTVYDRLADKYLHPNFILTLFLTGHGKFGEYLHRFHVSNDSGC